MTRETPLTWDQTGDDVSDEVRAAERLKFIPTISRETVTELLQHITPMLRNNAGLLCKFQPKEPCDPFNSSFNFMGEAGCGDLADMQNLCLLEAVPTYHTCGYHAIFRPTVAEVLAQLPEYLREAVTGFEVLFGQELTECVDLPGLYGHKTVTLFYGKVA